MKPFRKLFSNRFNKRPLLVNSIQHLTGFRPKNINWYERVFTHSSLEKTDAFGHRLSYERLEFLGDAILSAIISDYLFKHLPGKHEGYLTEMRSKIVRREFLNQIGLEMNLYQHLKSNVAKEQYGQDVHGNMFEALVGAVYLDQGIRQCRIFVEQKVITPYVDLEKLENKVLSYKGLLVDWFQKTKKHFVFEALEDNGQEKKRHYAVQLVVDGKVVAKARETNKKRAFEKVAKRAYFLYQKQMNNA